jgi:hypothetical protein
MSLVYYFGELKWGTVFFPFVCYKCYQFSDEHMDALLVGIASCAVTVSGGATHLNAVHWPARLN